MIGWNCQNTDSLSTSLNSPFKGNLLLLRDCIEIMGSASVFPGIDITRLTCGEF
jgi:hypothetical protein